MEFQFGIAEPGVDKTNHLLVSIYASELVEGVFEEDIGCIDAVGLVRWEALIVLFEDLDDVHLVSLGF